MASEKVKIIGILGGIGSGKSTVAAQFSELGCRVIDADKLAHEVLGRPEVKEHIKGHFGEAVFDEKGEVDREKMAEIVFSDEKKLKFLTSIVHPVVMELVEELISKFEIEKSVKAIVLDVPLLAEVGWENRCDVRVFVDSSMKNRAVRAQNRGLSDKNQLKNREKLQISLDKKADMSHYIVNNNSNLSALKEQVEEIFTKIINGG